MSLEKIIKTERIRPKYRQPHNIVIPGWIDNPALADHYRMKQHGQEKYKGRYQAKYNRSKWNKRQR